MLTDLEMTRLCAEALGWKHLGAVGVEPPARGADQPGLWCLSGANDWWMDPEGNKVCGPCSGSVPDPLHDDAQAMALVKRFGLALDPQQDGQDLTGGDTCSVCGYQSSELVQ